jgi:hypothetical protein
MHCRCAAACDAKAAAFTLSLRITWHHGCSGHALGARPPCTIPVAQVCYGICEVLPVPAECSRQCTTHCLSILGHLCNRLASMAASVWLVWPGASCRLPKTGSESVFDDKLQHMLYASPLPLRLEAVAGAPCLMMHDRHLPVLRSDAIAMSLWPCLW